MKAEMAAKVVQLDIVKAQAIKAANEAEASKVLPEQSPAQLSRAKSEAAAAAYQPDMAPTQLDKAQSDAVTARFAAQAAQDQPAMVAAQLEKVRNEAQISGIQVDVTNVSLQKLKLETQAAAFQPPMAKLQLTKLGVDTQLALISLPIAKQGMDLTNAYMNAMGPLMKGWFGIMGGEQSEPQQAPSYEATPAPAPASAPKRRSDAAPQAPPASRLPSDVAAWNDAMASSRMSQLLDKMEDQRSHGKCDLAEKTLKEISVMIPSGNGDVNQLPPPAQRQWARLMRMIGPGTTCIQH